jgi:hypothetical protein
MSRWKAADTSSYAVPLLLVGALTLAACASPVPSGQQRPPTSRGVGAVGPTNTRTPPVAASASKSKSGVRNVPITLTVGDIELPGALEDSPAARDFAELLPLTVQLSDFHSSEKISDLPRRLKVDEAPSGFDPRVGDIAYYAPWGNLALYYRDAPYAEGLVRLGSLEADAIGELSRLRANATVVLSLA